MCHSYDCNKRERSHGLGENGEWIIKQVDNIEKAVDQFVLYEIEMLKGIQYMELNITDKTNTVEPRNSLSPGADQNHVLYIEVDFTANL